MGRPGAGKGSAATSAAAAWAMARSVAASAVCVPTGAQAKAVSLSLSHMWPEGGESGRERARTKTSTGRRDAVVAWRGCLQGLHQRRVSLWVVLASCGARSSFQVAAREHEKLWLASSSCSSSGNSIKASRLNRQPTRITASSRHDTTTVWTQFIHSSRSESYQTTYTQHTMLRLSIE